MINYKNYQRIESIPSDNRWEALNPGDTYVVVSEDEDKYGVITDQMQIVNGQKKVYSSVEFGTFSASKGTGTTKVAGPDKSYIGQHLVVAVTPESGKSISIDSCTAVGCTIHVDGSNAIDVTITDKTASVEVVCV